MGCHDEIESVLIEAMVLSLQKLRRIPENTRGILSTLLFAAAAAGAAVAFLWLTNLLFRVTIVRLSTGPALVFVIGSLIVISLTSAASGLLMQKVSPKSAGSGVPELKAAYWKDLGLVQMRSVIVKFIGGVLTLGGGTSLGREGPSVYVGGGVASNIAAALGIPRTGRRQPSATGAAASLGCGFQHAACRNNVRSGGNARKSSSEAGSSEGSSLPRCLGRSSVEAFLGRQPAFTLPSVEGITWLMYLILPLVAAVASFIGVGFQTLTLTLRSRVRERSRLPAWLRPLSGALVTWALGCAVFLINGHTGVFGLGYNDLSLALNDKLVWQVAGVLVVAKFVATIASYGWGAMPYGHRAVTFGACTLS